MLTQGNDNIQASKAKIAHNILVDNVETTHKILVDNAGSGDNSEVRAPDS